MKAGYLGTFVISWAQSEVDGIAAAPLEMLTIGSQWRWSGEALRVDGPSDVLILTGPDGEEDMRRRAARKLRRLMGAAVSGRALAQVAEPPMVSEQGFTVTDGLRAYVVTLVDLPDSAARLVMFAGRVPPSNCDLWVVDRTLDLGLRPRDTGGKGVICFVRGTCIDTAEGPRPVETLRPGMRVLTRDDGPQEILWIGQRRMTGARLHAMPQLRPVRIRAGALGQGGTPRALHLARREAGQDLLVSPQHRLLLRGPAAQMLFNAEEVLASARDLLDDSGVRVEAGMPEVTYLHLMFERHQILWANGVECESFHPADADLDLMPADQRAALETVLPGVAAAPALYGATVRRALKGSEMAILRHDLAA
ncbi:Hint domain-containing protein [Phaeovulum sp. W22_SRMD_FR3]|uniref:Hint domain-containing protein n=1 Tax=Phaeovulum sp. W22_SRMD_FR3 TaxID=3240274 RepID=UPI003F9CE60E